MLVCTGKIFHQITSFFYNSMYFPTHHGNLNSQCHWVQFSENQNWPGFEISMYVLIFFLLSDGEIQDYVDIKALYIKEFFAPKPSIQ